LLYAKNWLLYSWLFLHCSLAYYDVTHASCSFTCRINLIGLPPHTCIAGTTLPGGTTLFGVIMAPYSITAPYKTTELCPIKAFYFKMHEYKVDPCWTTQSSWI
jgi:hypothetical protein